MRILYVAVSQWFSETMGIACTAVPVLFAKYEQCSCALVQVSSTNSQTKIVGH